MCATSVKGSGWRKYLHSRSARRRAGPGRNTDRAIGNFEPFDKIAVKLFELSNLGGNNDRRSADTGQAVVAVNLMKNTYRESAL